MAGKKEQIYSGGLIGIAAGQKVFYDDGSGILKPVTVSSIIDPDSTDPRLVIRHHNQTTETVPANKVQA